MDWRTRITTDPAVCHGKACIKGTRIMASVQQALGGQPDERVIDVCRREDRTLITLDLDCFNILSYPPADFAFRLANQAQAFDSIGAPEGGQR
jgi:hypothetical protein